MFAHRLNAFRVPLPAIALLTVLGAAPAWAQLDRVYPTSGAATSGTIQQISRDAVQIRTSSGATTIPSNEIRKIVFGGEPSPLSRARDLYLDEQYEPALEQLRSVELAKLERPEIRADAEFYIAAAQGRKALEGNGDKKEAVGSLIGAARSNIQSWHFYEISRLLGDLASALGSTEHAVKYYSALGTAPFPEYKLQARYSEGWAQLQNGNFNAARQRFEDVVSSTANSEEALRLQKLARVGRAQAMAGAGEAQAALDEVQQMIDQGDPSDMELFARLYNARGAALSSLQDYEGAVLAYLATHLMFSAQTDAHAEALRQLVQLWPKVGRPERASEYRSILERLYPGISG